MVKSWTIGWYFVYLYLQSLTWDYASNDTQHAASLHHSYKHPRKHTRKQPLIYHKGNDISVNAHFKKNVIPLINHNSSIRKHTKNTGVRRMIRNDMEPLTAAVCDAPLRGKSYFLASAFARSTNRLVDSFNGGMVEGIINLTLVGLFLYSSLASSLDR